MNSPDVYIRKTMGSPDVYIRKTMAKKLGEIINDKKIPPEKLTELGIPASIRLGRIHRHSLFDIMHFMTLVGCDVEINVNQNSESEGRIILKGVLNFSP